MSRDLMINVLVTVTLVEMMVAIGLGVTVRDLLAVGRDPRRGRAGAAGELRRGAGGDGWAAAAVRPAADGLAGFLILAVCPGACMARR